MLELADDGLIGKEAILADYVAKKYPMLRELTFRPEVYLNSIDPSFDVYESYGMRCSFTVGARRYDGYLGLKTKSGTFTLKLKLTAHESGKFVAEETMPIETSNEILEACADLFRECLRESLGHKQSSS